MPVRAITL